jgi:hypothetical protein
MTTTTVKRGAGRPAHSERVNRHAQRTPLPPKPGAIEDAREAIAEATAGICPKEGCHRLVDHKGRCGYPTRAEQKVIAADPEIALKPIARIVGAMEPEMGFQQEIDAQDAATPSLGDDLRLATPVEPNEIETRSQTGLQTEPERPGATKSWGKAVAFRDEVRKLGWMADAGTAPDGAEEDIVEVLASRGDEHLYIAWKAGGLQHPVTYTIETRTIKMRNASQAKQYAARTVETASRELGKVATNKAFKPKATEPQRSRLPFDPSLATDEEVITALLGKTVAWHNKHREAVETGIMGRDAKRIKIKEVEGGERTVEFCCASGGFRAFHLSALTRVGGGRRYTVRDKTGQRVEREELAEES